jgi:hypothetical protein
MARVSELARSAEHQSAASELQRVERDYKRLAGFDIDTLNERPSLSVSPLSRNRVSPIASPPSTESDNWRQGK